MAMGILRLEMGRELKLVDEKAFRFLWVTDFPLFEWDEGGERLVEPAPPVHGAARRGPARCSTSDPAKVRAKAYDLVLNGIEVGGGSIRIHDSALQAKVFQLLSLSRRGGAGALRLLPRRARATARRPTAASRSAWTAWSMILAGESSLRDVIAFPKTASATDLMSGSPSPCATTSSGSWASCWRYGKLARPPGLRSCLQASLPLARAMNARRRPRAGRRRALFGNHDENLRFLEEHAQGADQGTTAASCWWRATRRGEAIAGQVFEQLGALMKDGYSVAAGDVRLAAQLLAQDGGTRAARLPDEVRRARRQEGGGAAQPEPARVPRADREARHGVRDRARRAPARPTWRWRRPCRACSTRRWPASCSRGPAVEAGEKLGFLPGDLQEKVDPYLRPLYDALYDLLDYEKVAKLLRAQRRSRWRRSPSCAAARSTTRS